MLTGVDRRSGILRGLFVTALAACLLSACSMFSSADKRYDPQPLTDYSPTLAVRQLWSVTVGTGGGLGFVPRVVGDAVYAATPDGTVSKVDLVSGTVVWRTDTKVELSAGVGGDGTITVVATPQGEVIALDDHGQIKWKARATSEVNEPPVVGHGRVVVRSGDYRIQAFDADSGEPLWSLQRPGPALALRANMQMLILDGLLVTGLSGGKIVAINLDNGHVQWEDTVSLPRGGSDLERLNDVVGIPQLQGTSLCVVSYQGRVVCFDVSQGGRQIWAKNFSSAVGLTVDTTAVYVPDQHDVMQAFGLNDGVSLWQQVALRNRQLTAPALLGQAVAVGDYQGIVHFLSRRDGHLLARLTVGGGAVVSPLQATTQGVLVQTGAGRLILISAD